MIKHPIDRAERRRLKSLKDLPKSRKRSTDAEVPDEQTPTDCSED